MIGLQEEDQVASLAMPPGTWAAAAVLATEGLTRGTVAEIPADPHPWTLRTAGVPAPWIEAWTHGADPTQGEKMQKFYLVD